MLILHLPLPPSKNRWSATDREAFKLAVAAQAAPGALQRKPFRMVYRETLPHGWKGDTLQGFHFARDMICEAIGVNDKHHTLGLDCPPPEYAVEGSIVVEMSHEGLL